MGQGWRRVSEAARQKLGLTTEKNFKPSSNARNLAMFKEATTFAGQLRQLERDLKALQKQIDGHFTSLRNILVSPLPRVYEDGLNGAVPSEEEPRMIGENVQVDRIASASQELKKRLEQDVILPLKAWLEAYRAVEVKLKELEALRLELDSRRRTVGSLQGKLERVKTLPQTHSKRDFKIKDTADQKEHKEEKMERTQIEYTRMELVVYNSLFTLIKDTSVFRDYAAAALYIVQDCFHTAFSSFESTAAECSAATTGYAVENQSVPRMPYDNQSLPAEQLAAAPRQNKLRKDDSFGQAADSEAVDQAYPPYTAYNTNGNTPPISYNPPPTTRYNMYPPPHNTSAY